VRLNTVSPLSRLRIERGSVQLAPLVEFSSLSYSSPVLYITAREVMEFISDHSASFPNLLVRRCVVPCTM
jgi:hypothetical protein